MARAYFWSLADEPSELITAAARESMRTSKWFPKPSELIAIASDIQAVEVRDGIRALPPHTPRSTPQEQLATLRRCQDKAHKLGIILHHSVADRIQQLERGAA